MPNIVSAFSAFIREEEGQDIIEYGLLAAFIAIVVAAILYLFSTELETIYNAILEALNNAAGSV